MASPGASLPGPDAVGPAVTTFASHGGPVLAERVGADDERFRAAWNLWVYHVQHARIETARTVADELLALAERSGDDGMLLQAHHSLWFTTLAQGSFDLARAAEVALHRALTVARAQAARGFEMKILADLAEP